MCPIGSNTRKKNKTHSINISELTSIDILSLALIEVTICKNIFPKLQVR